MMIMMCPSSVLPNLCATFWGSLKHTRWRSALKNSTQLKLLPSIVLTCLNDVPAMVVLVVVKTLPVVA